MKNQKNIKWAELLVSAVSEEGQLMAAYSAFHNYSLGNQLLAWFQCVSRGIEVSPINTYKGWQEIGRQVKKGAKAIELCMPVIKKSKKQDENGDEQKQVYKRFIYRKHWFLLSDTEGEALPEAVIPGFDFTKALTELDIQEIPFEYINGNAQGYARVREIAVSPIATLPFKTRFHEMAHVVLGHTAENLCVDSDRTPRDIREVEAESVAYLLCSFLGLEGDVYCRGYIQHWLSGDVIPEKSAQKIFAAADKILKAGQVISIDEK